MLRPVALLIAGLGLVAATTAEACSCQAYATQAGADRAGEEAYRQADLIVEATVGAAPASHAAICPAGGGRPRAANIGRRLTAHHSITVHRVLKGKPPRAPVVAGATTTVGARGCSSGISTCDVGVRPGIRRILVLNRTSDGRFQSMSLCGLMALRQSKRGRTLFGAM